MKCVAVTLAAFSLTLTLTACGSHPSNAGSAQIIGTVTAGPTCPVERAGSPCPNRPVPGASVQATASGTVRASAVTDSAGRYALNVSPGTYTVLATNIGGFRSTAQRQVSVQAGQQTTVDLVVDTGIR